MADDKKKKKSLPRAYDEDTKERTKGKAAEATERAAQRRKEWEAKTKESTERARARTKQMTGYNSHGKTFGTKAGTKEPAFGVDVRNAPSSTMGGLDALSSASSFEEYARKRREQDKEQGVKSAAARLAERNAAVNRAAMPEETGIDYAKAAENLRGVDGYGWKRVGNQVVFVTPGSPLPKPTEQNTATPAQAPGLYGIAPADYVNAMNAVSRRMQGDNSAEAQKAYDDALKMLGDNAPDYVSWRKADYYERYGDVVNAEELAGDQPIQYSGYGGQDGITLKEAKKYTNSPYAVQGRDHYELQRWSQTTQQERDAYQLMLSLYGQEAADEYMKGLRGELNQRLAGATAQEAASYAQEHPVLGSLKTVVNAPVQGAGMLEMGVEKLFGRDVDLYDPRLNLSRETEAARGTVAQNLGGVGGFLYNTGMSMVDNLANMAVYGGLGSIATTISMGAGSAASAFNSAVERGASENQAMGAAALSGIAEALFEKVSLDNVITLARGGGLKTVVGNIAKQSGIEASEELFTGIANEIGDRLIMGGLSNYELAMAEYMRNGMSEAEAKKQAMLDTAKEIGLGALGGALSGGLMGAGGQAVSAITGANTMQQTPTANRPARPSVPNMTPGAANAPVMRAQPGTTAMNANTQRMLAEAARQRAEAEQASMDEREQLMKEYQPEAPIVQQPAADVEPVKVRGDETRRQERAQREEERDYMPSPAQVKQQQAETAKPEQVEVQKNKSEETASEGENGQMLKTQRTATVRDEDGVEKQVSVVGVMMDEGTPIMITRNEQGETDYTLADEMTFDADETELLGYEGIERMDAKGLRNYLDNYDASKGTAKEYADAYNTVFKRASAGLDYQQAAMENDMARTHMTEDARMSAYAAGLNAYNQTHETVQPAAVETTQASEAPAYAAMSAKEGGSGGRISRRYTQAAFGKLSKEGKQNAVAQMELLNAIASRTGRTITIVDSIVGKGGGHANALYNPETGEIRIALDATGGAYTYAAMHELTHAMKQEHAGEWKSFAGFVKETLKNNKQNWDELVQYQMDQFGYTREQAEEEVICNTAPAMLQDESNVLKLYKGNRKLFERVVDWVKGMLKDIKAAGKALSTRSKSWAQMDALAKDRKALQEMYDRMMAVMESQPITPADLKNKTKFSMQEAVERKGDLIATHNISLANLREMVRIGGMPMPSIAVIKAKIGHVTYGPISMMFGKDSIDPKKDKRNRLYGNDAYTPSVYGAGARADVKSWEAFLKKLSDTVDAGTAKELKPYLQGKVGVVDEVSKNTVSIWENGVVYTRKEDMIAELSDSVEAKLAYLEEKGMPDDLFAPFAQSNDKAKQVSEFEKRLNEAAEQKAVEKWLEKELGKIFGEKIVTSYGGTAVPFTAENVLDNLHTQLYYGNVNTLDKTFATAVKTYRSVDEARKDKNRLGVDPEEAEKAYKAYETLVEDVKARVWEENIKRWNEGKIKGGLTPEEVVVDAGSIRSNPLKVRAHFAKFGLRVTNKTFQKIMELYKAAENIPTHYFESKPDRIVGFDEVRYAVVPESYRQDVEELFAQAGISTKVLTYKDGDDASRIAVMNSDDVEDVKFSMRDEDGKSHYDYSKPFAEQIDDWLDGNFPKGDTFLVSSTPDVLQKIGFSKLPMSYDQKHMRQVLGKAKNKDHDLGVDFMKALPELIADPVAIVTAPKNDGSIMMVLAHQNKNANDRPVVGIVRVEKGGAYNKIYVDANKLETAHSRGDLDEIITAAVEKEKAGGVGVYYVTEKKSLHSVLEHGQSQVLDSLNRTGYMHSIHDTGSNVNAELMDQTESRQFKRWFGDSKVVNEDGSPKLMYRGGNEDIEIFDRRKSKASNLYGRGFYFTESEEHAKQYGGVNSYYLRIEHPLDASSGEKQINQSQMRNFLEAVAEDEDYGLENYGYGATVDSVLRSLRGKDDFAALQDINATAVGDFVAAVELFNEVNGTKYDGIITPTETVVFDSRQIKSATDNAGTFDPENPNVKFSMQDSEGNELSDEQQEYFEDSKVRDEEGNLLVMYHGTTAYGDINVFKPGKKGWLGPGIYLTNKKADAQHYADAMGPGNGKMYTLYANVENPLYVYESDPVPEIMRAIYGSDRAYNTRAAKQANSPSMLTGADIKKLRAKGYDGIIWKFYKSVEVSVFEPNQIKNVDNDSPTDAKDIRYSMRETDENVQDAMSAEEKAYAQVKGHRITAAEADKLAGEMLKLANSDYDQQKAASRLSRTIDYIERGEDVDWNQVDDELTSLAADVMSKSRTLDLEHEEMAKPIRDYLRTTRIRLTESQRAEAESLSGTYDAYRKNLFGRVRLISTGGTPLDSLWSELTAMNPELFPADAAEGEMAVLLTNAVDALKPVYHSGMGMNMEESANWLAGKVHEAYLSLPTVKAAAKNAKTFGESIVALKNAMKRFEETSWTEYQNALREIRAARGAQKRTQQQEETEALRKKYVQWREKDTAQRKERELKRKYRARIERTAGTLANWIDKPTDAKHVPANVEDSVKAMLSTLDFSGKDTKAAATLTEKLDRMATEIERAQKGSQEGKEGALYFEVDQQMIDQIRLVAERIRGNTSYQQMEGRGVYDLNSMELKELSKWLDVVKHVLTNASKMRGSYLTSYGSVAEVQQASYTELRKKKPWTAKKWLTKQWEKYFGADMLDSFTFFERLGPTANAVFKGLRDGFDEVTQHLRTAEEFSQKIFEGLKLEELTGPNAKQHAVELSDGETVKMTKGEMMAIYVLSRREQARGHMYAEQNGEGIRLRSDENPDPHQLKAADEKKIADMLTEEEKRAAEGMQKFLSKECASWGNETSMKLLGYRKFGEEYYWPISTDERTKNSGKLEDNFDANINAIQNQGMTKATVEGAKNAIVIDDIFDSYTRHISNMAAYSAYAIPLSDFNKWYNNTAVRRSIAKVMGPKGEEYVKNLIMALNGSARAQSKTGVERALSTMNRNAKTASVGLNARVVIQQPTSIARAAMYISPKYLAEAAMHKAPSADIINKYCGIAAWKNWGFFETNVGPNLKEMLTGTTTGMAKLREKSMYFAAMMDQWTMNRLWVASELETRDLYPELKPKSEEYYKQVGKRMSEIVDRTQVVDSVFHRSQMMRSKSWMAQTLTNFMSEPTKTYNLLAGAIYDFAENRNSKPVQKRLARAFGVVTVTSVLTAAASAVVDAFRDDEDEKKWLEKYMEALGSNTIDNLNPLGMLPLVKDIWSIVQGYSNSNMAFQSVQKLVWGYEAFIKYAQGGGNQNWYGVLYKMAQAGSSISGIPVSNLMRDFNGVWQTVTGVSLTLKPEGQKKQRLSKMYDALNKGDKEKAKEIREYLRLKADMTPKEIDTAIAEMLEADPKIKEAYEAKAARDFATMNRAINALTAKGFIKESVDKAITSYAEDQKPKTEKVKDPGEQLAVTLYSNEDVADAVRILAGVKDGSVTESDVKAMISERVAGSDAEDPKDTVYGNIRSELKKDYLAADARDDMEAMARIGTVLKSLLKTEPEDMAEWVKDQHGVDLRSAIDAGNSTAALKVVNKMRKNDGKTDSEIKRSLDKYKQLYIDAVNAHDTKTANQIKTMLKSLGLKGKNGDSLYTDKHFADWLK